MGSQVQCGDKSLGDDMETEGYVSTQVQGGGQSKVIVWVPSGLRVDGEGMGHKNELTQIQNERWMAREPRAPRAGYRRDVRALQRADEL